MIQEIFRCKNHGRDAEAALRSIPFDEFTLERMHLLSRPNCFDGRNLLVPSLNGKDEAGVDEFPVH